MWLIVSYAQGCRSLVSLKSRMVCQQRRQSRAGNRAHLCARGAGSMSPMTADWQGAHSCQLQIAARETHVLHHLFHPLSCCPSLRPAAGGESHCTLQNKPGWEMKHEMWCRESWGMSPLCAAAVVLLTAHSKLSLVSSCTHDRNMN